MFVRFWGTRGSIATPGPSTAHFGGNTSCVEVRSGDTLAILDCGTGVRPLGAHLAKQGGPIHVHLMLTHIHWDHIQGFPFFLPVFLPGVEMDVYGAGGLEQGLEEAMSGQMQYTYFPVRLSELRSRLTFHEVGEGSFEAGSLHASTQFLNHTCPAIGYRLAAGSATVAYMTDHEPFWPHNPELPLADALIHPGDRRHVAFLRGVDLLIHDAQYTAEEYPARRGWGHSTVEYVVDVALSAGVRRLALFHHDPSRDDAAVEEIVARAIERVRQRGGELEVFAAAEGEEVELSETGVPASLPELLPMVAAFRPLRVVLLGSPERRRALREALVEDGYHLTEADVDAVLPDLLMGEPDLVVVVPPTDEDPVAPVAAASLAAKGQPVVAVLEGAVDEALLRRIGEVAADVVVAPYTLPNLRARIRACVVRRQLTSVREQRPAAMDSIQMVDRLSRSDLDSMLQAGAPCVFGPGEILFHQGDPPGGVYYLQRGLVRVLVRAPDGREVTVGYAGPGDMVGEMSALDSAPRSATVVAMEPLEVTFVSKEGFRKVVAGSPETALRLLRMLVRRLRDVDQRIVTSPPATDGTPQHAPSPSLLAANVN